MLDYFAANAWNPGAKTTDELLTEFCKNRYGKQSDAFNTIWSEVLPIAQMLGWGGNFWSQANRMLSGSTPLSDAAIWRNASKDQLPRLAQAPEIYEQLSKIEWSDPFVKRDSIDLARTTTDRLLTCARVTLLTAMHDWKDGKISTEQARDKVQSFERLVLSMRDILALHEDYSMYETLVQLNAAEKIQNPDFDRVLLDNASCGYCQSHQYELMNYWYLPSLTALTDWCAQRLDKDDKSDFAFPESIRKAKNDAYQKTLNSKLADMRPTLERTPENYRRTMEQAAAAARLLFGK